MSQLIDIYKMRGRSRRTQVILLLVVSFLIVIAEGIVSGYTAEPEVGIMAANIEIVNFTYKPKTYSTSVGSTVSWHNSSSTTHTVTAVNGSFNSGNIPGNGNYSRTFNSAGTYDYFCTLHSGQTGTVVVTAPKRVESNDPSVFKTGNWQNYVSPNASSGDVLYSNVTGDGMSYTFFGTGFKVIGPKAKLLGKVKICYDGLNCITVDQYSSTVKWQQVLRSVTNLPLATHDIGIQVTGTKNILATGRNGAIDAFDIFK